MRVGGLEGDAGAWELGLGERLGIRRERFGKETGTRGLELAERLGSCRGRLGEEAEAQEVFAVGRFGVRGD